MNPHLYIQASVLTCIPLSSSDRLNFLFPMPLKNVCALIHTHVLYIPSHFNADIHHTYSELAEEELKVAIAERSAATLRGAMQAVLDILDQDVNRAKENLAENKLFAAIAQNALAAEIDARKQSLFLIRAANKNRLPVTGND